MIRSSSRSFAPSNLFNERIYELNDNSGSVMTDHTPTFASNYHQPFRGADSDAMIHSRTMQSQQQFGVNLGYVQSPMSQQPQPEPWHQHSENNAGISRKGLSLNLTNSLWPSRDVIATPERPLLTEDFTSSSPEHNNAQNQNVVTSHIYHEIPENHQPIHQIQKSQQIHQIPENHQPIHRPIQAQLFHHQQLQGGSNFSNNQQPQQGGNFSNNQQPQQGGSSCNSTSSSGYGTSTMMRYDNVRGEARGPFVSYPILEDRSILNNSVNLANQRPKRPTELALHNSPLI